MTNLKSELLQLTANREKDLLAEIGRLSLQLRTFEIQAHTLQAKLSDLEADGTIDHMGRKLPLPGHHKDCGHGKDGWSLCTCDNLRNRDARQFSELMNDVDASTLTTPHVAEPKCSKCGDTGRITIFYEGIATPTWCTACPKGRPSPLAESLTKAFQSAAADAVRTTLDRGGTAVGEVQGQWQVVSKTCEHGNTECKRCGIGQPTIKTPEGKPLLPAAEFAAMQIKKTKELGLAECNFQRRTGRTTAMVLKALEFVKDSRGRVNVEVHNNRMKKYVNDLLKHYSDEMGVRHDQLSLILVRAPGEYSPIVALNLRDNVFDDMKETKPTRDPRQDLKVGEHVRFEIEVDGVIIARQSAGIVKDYDGNDFEPVQYVIKKPDNFTHYIPYNKIINVIGKEK